MILLRITSRFSCTFRNYFLTLIKSNIFQKAFPNYPKPILMTMSHSTYVILFTRIFTLIYLISINGIPLLISLIYLNLCHMFSVLACKLKDRGHAFLCLYMTSWCLNIQWGWRRTKWWLYVVTVWFRTWCRKYFLLSGYDQFPLCFNL